VSLWPVSSTNGAAQVLRLWSRIDDSGIFPLHSESQASRPRLEYKFIVDGEWKVDPLCTNVIDNGVGGQNSYFVVGEFHEPPELEAVESIPHGHVEEFELASERLGNRRAMYVYLPPVTIPRGSPLPALYVHDGGEYLSRARLPVVLDNLIHAGEVAPLIAVMVDPVNRMTEYRLNGAYLDFVVSELMPHIDGRFHTLASSKGRGVMGASLGRIDFGYPRAHAAGSVFQGRKPVGRVSSARPGSNPQSGR